MIWLLAILLLWPGGAEAQRRTAKKAPAAKTEAPAPAANRWPIHSLAVEGLHNYTPEQVLAVAGLKIGQVAGKAEFDAARDRLTATGAFETVSYRFGPGPDGTSYAASFQVTEAGPAYPVKFEDLGAWLASRDPLFGSKIAVSRAVLDRYARLIQEFLAGRHVTETVVSVMAPAGAEEFTVVFRPSRRAPAVAQVSFTGNQLVPSTALQNAISEVAVGSAFGEDQFRQYLDHAIRPLYERQGRLRVSFPKIEAEPAKDVRGVDVKVTVDEGPLYKLGGLRLDGLLAARPEELMKTGAFKIGEPANFDEIGAGIERIRKRLRRQGYMRVEIRPERSLDDAKKIVNLVLHVEQGAQFLMGDLKIEGLTIYDEPAIRKAWGLPNGKPFDADYPDAFLSRLREEGVFENLKKAHSQADVNEQTRTVNVTLYFQ